MSASDSLLMYLTEVQEHVFGDAIVIKCHCIAAGGSNLGIPCIPGLLIPSFVACSTKTGEGLVKLTT